MKTLTTYLSENIWRIILSTLFALGMWAIGSSPDVINTANYSSLELVGHFALTFGLPFTIQWFLIPCIIDAC